MALISKVAGVWTVDRGNGPAFAVATVALVGLTAGLLVLDLPLRTYAAPFGTLDFELARTAGRAHSILASWNGEARKTALLALQLDYLYLIVYPAWLSMAALGLARRLGGAWRWPGAALGRIVWLAMPLDAVENAMLGYQLVAGASAVAAEIAWTCAVPKFTLVALALLYIVPGGIGAGLRRLRLGRAGVRAR